MRTSRWPAMFLPLSRFLTWGRAAIPRGGELAFFPAIPYRVLRPAIFPLWKLHSGQAMIMRAPLPMDGQFRCGMTMEESFVMRQGCPHRKMGPPTLTGPIFVTRVGQGNVREILIRKLVPASCGVNLQPVWEII